MHVVATRLPIAKHNIQGAYIRYMTCKQLDREFSAFCLVVWGAKKGRESRGKRSKRGACADKPSSPPNAEAV